MPTGEHDQDGVEPPTLSMAIEPGWQAFPQAMAYAGLRQQRNTQTQTIFLAETACPCCEGNPPGQCQVKENAGTMSGEEERWDNGGGHTKGQRDETNATSPLRLQQGLLCRYA